MTKIIGFGYNNNVLLFLRAFMLISKGLPMKEKFYKTLADLKGSISEATYSKLDRDDKLLFDWIVYVCTPEEMENPKDIELKKKIYKIYAEKINLLINKYEVYTHYFSDQFSNMIMEIVGELSKISLIDESQSSVTESEVDRVGKETKTEILIKILDMIYCLYYLLCLEISDYCLAQGNIYKKIIKRFKYKGIDYIPYKGESECLLKREEPEFLDNKFYTVIEDKLVKLEEKREEFGEYFKSFFKMSNKKNSYNFKGIKNGQELISFDELLIFVEDMECYLKTIERHYPSIINNGYSPSKWSRVVNFCIFWGLPIALGVLAVVIKIKKGG